MSDLKILVWKNKDATGEPETEVRIPMSLAKWVPKMMKFVPAQTRAETWGHEVNFDEMFIDIEKLVQEAAASGQTELMDVKTPESHVKILVEG